MYVISDNKSEEPDHSEVLVVGAGPAGIGVAAALKCAGVQRIKLIDAREIGASFLNWPKQMSLLTPSFHSNAFGLTDLNAIDPLTSPADFIRTQHPSGEHYAKYLQAVAEYHELDVSCGIEVQSVSKVDDQFIVNTNKGDLFANYLIWAAGQFFSPKSRSFDGAEHAIHSSSIKNWDELQGEEFTIIGGYESGIDAALNLVDRGKAVRLHSRGEPWTSDDPDPSRSLSPRTLDRLRELLQCDEKAKLVEFYKNSDIRHIEYNDGWWTLFDQDDIPSLTRTRPILANGFYSGLGHVTQLFDHDENNLPVFSEEADESTITPGLFYSGPSLVHRNSLFCFIYKFRARFGVIAREIANRLSLDEIDDKLSSYRDAGFMNTDLDCCTNCECAIKPADSAPEPSAFAK